MTPDSHHLLLAAFAEELGRCGVTDACTSPGSRCAPIVMAFVREPALRAHSHIDERCAGFFAVGAARASERPAVVTCTSGTAAANLAPAVIEAHEGRVPMIAVTADRPPELRGIGAGQAIDQLKLYGDAVRMFAEVDVPDAGDDAIRWVRALACRAFAAACGPVPGPVHLNWPLREPLMPTAELGSFAPGRPAGRPWIERVVVSPPLPASILELVSRSRRAVVIAGRGCGEGLAALCAGAGYPLLADPLSRERRGPAAIAHYDLLLRHAHGLEQPELVIRAGDLPTSKPLRTWLASLGPVPQVAIHPLGALNDPDSNVSHAATGDPRDLVEHAEPAAAGWLQAWRDLDACAAAAVAETIGDELSEPAVAATLGARLGSDATLFCASSMPIRDIEAFWAVRDDPPRVLSNRGANGIDGTISSAFGAAACSDGPVYALVGDVAFAHDIGGLLAARRLDLDINIVMVDNGGGGIFDFLAVSGERDLFEQHIATPTGLDAAAAAALYRLDHVRADTIGRLEAALERRGTIIEVPSHRSANLAVHARAWDAVGAALGAATPG